MGACKHKYHVQLKHIFIQHTKTTSNLNEQYNIVMWKMKTKVQSNPTNWK